MTFDEIQIGDKLVHNSNAMLSGWVRGVDEVGPVRPAGPCVWIGRPGRGMKPWVRVGANELDQYTIGVVQ